MSANLFNSTVSKQNYSRPPVWFMRQAGRYHAHYQALRKKYSFMDICKIPEIACEATMGPIRDFDFDAAILFSDLLFPLETMGMGLTYTEGGPRLGWHLEQLSNLNQLRGGAQLVETLAFQGEALKLIRKELSSEKGLLGFVGGPLTLFCYAVEGSHKGDLSSSRQGLRDGRFEGFFEKLLDLLAENMVLQAQAGADVVAVLDTCAGEFEPSLFKSAVVPYLKILFEKFKEKAPNTPIIYYSKGTGPEHWRALKGLPISGLGIDWHHNMAQVLSDWSGEYAIQGNIDPNWLFLEPNELEIRLRRVFNEVKALPSEARKGWVCGLGHGVLPKTPEKNVRLFLSLQKEMFKEQS
jgi:uroporphyrinogen decarboxylase